MWVARVRKQTEYMYSSKNQNESFNVFKEILSIYKKNGVKGIYRGLTIELIGTPHVIIQFNLYEYFTSLFKRYCKTEEIPYKYVLVSSILAKSKFFLLVYEFNKKFIL
jgi:hypothetical protein